MKSLATFSVLSFFLLVIASGCASTQYIYPNYTVAHKNLTFSVLKPVALIGAIESGNKIHYDSLGSVESKQRLFSLANEMAGSGAAGKELSLDTSVYRKVYNEVANVGGKLLSVNNKSKRQAVVDSYRISPLLDSIMQSHGIEHLVVAYQRGFYRNKKNYSKQAWKGLGVGLLTLGTYVPVPVKSNSTLYTWVVDGTRKTIVYSNASLQEIDPLDKLAVSQQLCAVFQGFYTKKSPTGACFHE